MDSEKRNKLIKVISHDVERIERLITDYSQMLKDEATLSRTKMKKIDLTDVVNSVVEDFNSDLDINTSYNVDEEKVMQRLIDYSKNYNEGKIQATLVVDCSIGRAVRVPY